MVDSNSKNTLKSFYDCLYGYSHYKFYEFIRIPEVGFLFKKVLSNSSIENIIEKCKTMKRNQNHYSKSAQSLSRIIDSHLKRRTKK